MKASLNSFIDAGGVLHTAAGTRNFLQASGWIIAYEGTLARPDLGLWKASECKDVQGTPFADVPMFHYCEVRDERLQHFFSNPMGVFMCGTSTAHEVQITPAIDGKYWAWIDDRVRGISIIFEQEQAFRICFPYKLETMVAKGSGLVVKVNAQLTGKTVIAKNNGYA